MADNTTTYKAVVDVETKGLDNFNKLNSTLNETLEGFEDIGAVIEKTRKALQKAKLSGDEVEFKRLRKELNGLQRTFEETEIQSQRFTDALAGQPGVVGLVGQSIKGLDGGMKVLAANPIIAVVTILAGLFLTLKESLSKTERGQALLNKASEAFGKILGPIFATIEMVAFPIFEYLIGLLEKVAGAFGWLAEQLGVGTEQIEQASRASSEVLQQAYDEEQERQKTLEEEKTKKQEEEAQKRLEQLKKEQEERKKILEEAQKILLEAELSLLSQRDREVREREMRYQEELSKLKLAGTQDLTNFEEEYRRDLLEINKKYDDEELKQKEEALKREEELKKKAQEDEKARLELIAQQESQIRADRAQRLIAEYNYENALKAQSFEAELDLFDKTRELERQELVAQKVSNDLLIAFDKATATERINIERAQTETKLGIISNALGTIAEAVGKESVAGKALAISQALINTYMGATKALATYPPPFGAIAAGTVIAAGLLQVNAIRKQKLPSIPKPGGGSVSTSGGNGPSITTPSIGGISAPQIQTGGGNNPSQQIAETLAQATNKPIEAYVVSTKVSSRQALDRRTNSASTFSGG